MLRQIIYAVSLLSASVFVTAQPLLTQETPLKENIAQSPFLEPLATQPQWLHLLHYRKHYNGRVYSQNDSTEFFLSPQGKTDAWAELITSVAAFSALQQANNESAQCRFPARYHWIKSQWPDHPFIDQPCPEFEQWRDEIKAASLTLIFPASHINSPSSMYGHTLVRMDRADPNSSKLLAYSVNFAANADMTDNELVFSYKGLTGGYPGVVSVLPYYAKTNEYQHMEHRDIWEYPLNFTADEVAQFVRHIWETQDTYFDYFFFDENCSYRLLALFDAASERANLANEFFFTAVPVDTIRALQRQGLVAGAEYRASAGSELLAKSAQATDLVRQISVQLVDTDQDIHELLTPLTAQDQARALELAHAYARYLAVKRKQGTPELRQRTLAMLSVRSRIDVNSDFEPTPMPSVRDDQGHRTHRVQGWVGQSGDDAFTQFSLRMAYHEVMDLPSGFVPGSQIQMGQLDVRYQQERLRVEAFLLVDVLSLSSRNLYFKPTAWGVSSGLERFYGADAELYAYLKVGFGRAYDSPLGLWYGLLEGQLLVDDQFERHHQLSLGPRLGWLWQKTTWQQQVEAHWLPSVLGDDRSRRQLTWSLGYRWHEQWQLRANIGRQWQDDQAITESRVGFSWYY